jgi:predicted amidohydrolase
MGRPYQLVTMSKFLALCMELGAVVRADLGCLSVGAVGDASVLELVEGAGRGTAQSAAARGARAGGRRPMVASAAASGSGSVRRPTRRG